MPIRITGLNSGLDTDSIVQELVSAYATKKDSYVKAQTKLEWKMDAWKGMNSKIYGFYTSSLSSMRMSGTYNLKTSTVSNESAAKVTASTSAVSGTQKLKVKKLAASAYMTGGVVDTATGGKVTGSTKLTDMGIAVGSQIEVATGLKSDGSADKAKTITVKEGMTVNQMVAELKDAGVAVNFDEKNQRFFVSSAKDGAEGEFAITAANSTGLGALQSLGLFATKDIDGNATAEMKRYEWLAANGSGDAAAVATAVKGLVASTLDTATATSTVAEYENALALISKHDKNQALVNTYDEYNQKVADLEAKYGSADDINSYLIKTPADGDKEAVYYTDSEIADMQKFLDDNKEAYEAGSLTEEEKTKYENYTKTVDAKAYKTATNYCTNNADEYTAAKNALDADNLVDSAYNTALTTVAANKTAYTEAKAYLASQSATGDTGAARINAQDAVIELNGATFTSNTGTFSINGLSITAMQETGDEEITITTASDTKGIYDKIKSFFTKYNELMKEMDTAYNAASSGDYEPLTDDEMAEMTDTQIEKWETKIKDGLLRRDSTLGTVSTAMKNIMQTSFTINGEKYSLSTFGINTLGYFTSSVEERGCYHIDGDEDDSNTSGNADKLMAAISEDPETVVSFFQQLSNKLYDDLTKRMASSSVSSVYTIYNDKQMSSEYSDYKDKISDWEEKLEYYEDFYYKKFSAMETALSKLQSSTSALSGLLGGTM